LEPEVLRDEAAAHRLALQFQFTSWRSNMKLRHLIILAALLLSAATPSYTQVLGQNFKVFLGYSNLQGEGFFNNNTPAGVFNTDFFHDRTTLHGGNLEITAAHEGIGITADGSFNRNSRGTDFPGGHKSIDTDVTYFVAGPSFQYAGSRKLEPFARVMAGGANTRFKVSTRRDLAVGSVTSSFQANSTSFAMGAGGGLDLRIGNGPFRIRLVQIDYVPVFLRDKSVQILGAAGAIEPVNLEGQRQDNVRFSFGFVF